MKSKQKTERNACILKFTVHASALIDELDKSKTNSELAKELVVLLERVIDDTYKNEIIRSTSFLQTLENKFDTAIRKTMQEFNIKM